MKSRLERQKALAAAFGADDDDEDEAAAKKAQQVAPSAKRPKHNDAFFEELKRKHDSGEADVEANKRFATSGNGVRKAEDEVQPDDGYIHGSNLRISSLHPLVTEERLYELFRPYGPLNSVKVMWPRTDEEHRRGRNVGFVSFIQPRDAVDAARAMSGALLEGMRLEIDWGKSVKRSANPYTPATAATNSQCFRPHLPSMTNTMDEAPALGLGLPHVSTAHAVPEVESNEPPILISHPSAALLQRVIDVTARFVAVDGSALEKVILRRELSSRYAGNSFFEFLFDKTLPEHQYYRWKTYTHVVGDAGRNGAGWRLEPYRLSSGGALIQPPAHTRTAPDNTEKEQRAVKKPQASSGGRTRGVCFDFQRGSCQLGSTCRYMHQVEAVRHDGATMDLDLEDDDRDAGQKNDDKERDSRALTKDDLFAWQRMIATLNSNRENVRVTTGWALDRVEHAAELAAVLLSSLTPPGSCPCPPRSTGEPIRRFKSPLQASPSALLARLHLSSDLLFNCSLPLTHISQFRAAFQSNLPLVFDVLGARLRAQGRLSARSLSDSVLAVLRTWEDWSLFPRDFLMGLEASFLLPDSEARRIAAIEGAHEAFVMAVTGESLTKPDEAAAAAAAAAVSTEDSTIPRRARMCGIFPKGSTAYLQARVTYAEAYSKVRLGTDDSSVGNDKGASAVGEHRVEVDDDDVDGAPLPVCAEDDDIDGTAIDGEDCNDDDDIDGVPF